MNGKTFAELGKIHAIEELFKETHFNPFENPDFEVSNGGYIVSHSDVFLEGIDFDLVYFPLKHLGYKCVTAVTGEMYADFANPKTMSIKLGVSAKLDFEHIKELWNGIITAAKEHKYEKIDLDIQPSKNGLTISVCSTGESELVSHKRKPTAKSKDLICLSGSIGGAYFGFKILEEEKSKFEKNSNIEPNLEKYKMMVASYLKPEISPKIVSNFNDSMIYPSCGVIVNNGLSDAIKRVSRKTGLGAKIYADKIPFEGNSFELGKKMNIDPISAAMNGGNDYRLLFTIPILDLDKFRHDFQTFDIIGHLAQKEVGTVLVTPEGVELTIKAQGWNE